ncbi:probable RNA-directed DNA polymerase from transposon X-element [Trichonephila clavipes]|nr:probable RNA-directed DNA polymerase from transposon X-element [Trichonephila clavipes]
MNPQRRLLMVTWNAYGVRTRMCELQDFLNKYKPDIMALQETWLRPSHTLALANYKVYRYDRIYTTYNPRITSHGGTVILIKKSLKHTHIPTPDLNGVEATMVALTPERGDTALIISIYIPPSNSNHTLPQTIDTLMNQGFSSTIIMGDFNAKHSSWGCDVDIPRGVRLKTHIERSGYRILAPPTPTRYGYNSASTLDFAITQNADWPCIVTSRSELSSDHNPVTFDFLISTHFFPLLHKRYTNIKTNWEKFTQNITVPDNFTLPEDIDTQVTAFTNRLQQAYKNASKPLKSNDTFYISRDLKLFKDRNRVRKTWHYTRSPADKKYSKQTAKTNQENHNKI